MLYGKVYNGYSMIDSTAISACSAKYDTKRPITVPPDFRLNNFDVIRLFAALQVAVLHSLSYFGLNETLGVVVRLLELLPGVPIFFFVSGFLISKSYESNPQLSEYAQNRLLRIYPALFACTFLAIFSVYVTGYFAEKQVGVVQALPWVVSQLTVAQFYTPGFMRDFGVGTLNGSLWTITVELQFYVVIPIIYMLFRLRASEGRGNVKLILLICFFYGCQLASQHLVAVHPDSLIVKLLGVSFIPWIYMFLIGVLFQRNFDPLHRALSGKAALLMPAYLMFAFGLSEYLGLSLGNKVNPLLYLLLACAVFSIAYSAPTTSRSWLGGNDYSYGIYIYHLPVINLFLVYDKVDGIYALAVIALTVLLACASWWMIEKPCMALKKHPLNPLNKARQEKLGKASP